MELTTELLREKFIEYDRLYLGCTLPIPAFKLIKSYRTMGMFSCDKIIGRRRLKHPRIDISRYYDWTEEQLRDVLVHEMIHYYLAYHHIDHEITHGEDFLKMCDELNEKHGLNISVIVDATNTKRNKKAPRLTWALMRIFG